MLKKPNHVVTIPSHQFKPTESVLTQAIQSDGYKTSVIPVRKGPFKPSETHPNKDMLREATFEQAWNQASPSRSAVAPYHASAPPQDSRGFGSYSHPSSSQPESRDGEQAQK